MLITLRVYFKSLYWSTTALQVAGELKHAAQAAALAAVATSIGCNFLDFSSQLLMSSVLTSSPG
jgi:hypothetical protein